jgi:hypothetical protein
MRTTLRRTAAALATLAMLITLAVVGGGTVSAAGPVAVMAAADTYVQADRPTENFGSSVRWSAEGRTNIWRHGLLRFNVTVKAGEKITSAKLRAMFPD